MAKKCSGTASSLLLLCLPLAAHTVAAARTVPARGAVEASLPAAAAAQNGAGAGGVGAVDAKNLFVGVGGMGDLPGLPVVGGSYGGGFSNNGAGVFTGVTGPLGGVRSSVGNVGPVHGAGAAGGIPFGVFSGGGAPFGGVGGGYRGGGAGGVTP